MRNLWLRIGLGAAVIFAAGMFVVTLGRQVKTAAADAIRNGGRLAVPLALLPFKVNGHKVGSIREIHVQRDRARGVKQVRVVVTLKGVPLEELDDCILMVGHGAHSLFDCETPSVADAGDYIKIGEIRFEPSGVTRPILVEREQVRDWDGGDLAGGEVRLQADGNGANLRVVDADGQATVRLSADSAGVVLHARDEYGREIVHLQASASGVNLNVKSEKKGN